MKNLRITVEKAAFGGSFIGFCEGKAVFTDGVLPGEEVMVTPLADRGDYIIARTVEVLKTSPNRKESPCPVWPRCGGCSYLHTDYETELNLKKSILIDSLRRIGGIRDHEPRIISGPRFHYRSHVTLKSDHEGFGFFSEGSNSLVHLPEEGCLLADEGLNRAAAEAKPTGGEVRFAIDSSGTVHSSMEETEPLHEEDQGLAFERKIWNFYQANRFLRGDMLSLAREYASLKGEETFLDIGCGVGFFSLGLASRGNRGKGIDVEKSSIEWAKKNGALNGITSVSFQPLSASRLHPQNDRADVILADPPRAGLDKKTRKTILAMEPKRIVYISCNPATFARDLSHMRQGGYDIKKLVLLDMFPATRHIESMALLEL